MDRLFHGYFASLVGGMDTERNYMVVAWIYKPCSSKVGLAAKVIIDCPGQRRRLCHSAHNMVFLPWRKKVAIAFHASLSDST